MEHKQVSDHDQLIMFFLYCYFLLLLQKGQEFGVWSD
jgi:hypothetical protein